MSHLQHLLEQGINSLFPPRCGGCNDWNESLFCPVCSLQLRHFHGPLCKVCGKPFDALAKGANLCAECRPSRYHQPPAFTALRSCFSFEGPVREAVHHYKYEGRTSLAPALANELAAFWQQDCLETLSVPRCDVITPVPLHRWRLYRRGYNQSDLLAQQMAAQLQIPYKVLLKRIRPTRPQIHLGHDQRAGNVKNAFTIHVPSGLQGATILLIDDVCTTGATLRECASVLKKSGAEAVYALTLARQLPHPH